MSNYRNDNLTCPYIWNYIHGIKSGRINHCEDIDFLIDNIVIPVLHRDDVFVDVEKIEKGLALQKYFDFDLVEWEIFLFALIAGVYIEDDGYREIFFLEIIIIIGRGSGKNGFISFLCFYFLSPAHGIKKYDIDIIANSEDQAKRSFDDVYDVIKHPLKSNAAAINCNYSATKTEIIGLKTNSRLHYNTSSTKNKDSKRSGCIIKDEVHEYEKSDNSNTLKSGLGKVANPRDITITTDGKVRGKVMDKLKEKCRDILKEYNPQNRTLVFYCHIESEDEYKDAKNLIKAIPSIEEPSFRSLKRTVEKEIADLKFNPEYYGEFMAKRMNYPVGNNEIEVAKWSDIVACNVELPENTGGYINCVAAIDYTKTDDFMHIGLLYKNGYKWCWKHHTFVCTNSRDLKGIKAPLSEWEAEGGLTFVNDVEIHPDYATNWLKEQMDNGFIIHKVAMDNYRYSILSKSLSALGFCKEKDNIKLVRPSDLMIAAPIINSVFINQLLIWGTCRIMGWFTNNVKKVIDKKGNILYEKIEPHYRKTDGFMALAAAFTISDLLENDNTELVVGEPIIIGG